MISHTRLAVIFLSSFFTLPLLPNAHGETERPSILWLTTEDISAHLGCYGHDDVKTPTLDQLAADGVRYDHCYGVAAVCAVNRSGLITGCYPTTQGTLHMRCKARMPEHIRCYGEYLRAAGYYCTNNSKTDYNQSAPKSAWDESSGKGHWKNRPDKSQPFFAVFNYGATHESRYTTGSGTDPGPQPSLPPYYPNTPEARDIWRKYLNSIEGMDAWVAGHLNDLEEAGLADETIVFFYSDHGVGLPRGKRWLYDSGLKVPLIVRVPEKFRAPGQGEPGTASDELVSFLDLPATALHLAGVKIPGHMQGRAFLGRELTPPREYVFAARDRMDERYDIIRAVRDQRYKYIRNYQAWKPYYQYMNTPEKGGIMRQLRELHGKSELPPAAELFMTDSKPIEEFYDCQADPHEVDNLIDSQDPAHRKAIEAMRAAHQQWVIETRDIGFLAEPEIMDREAKFGNRYDILRSEAGGESLRKIIDFVQVVEQGDKAVPSLAKGLKEDDSAVRYWAAIGLGNLDERAAPAADALEKALGDESASVRIAAARALARLGQPEKALPTLTRELIDGEEWVQLNAAIVLDEMDAAARPAIDAMKKSLATGKNKYVVRVSNRALNELLGTNNTVR
jgi:arylsulfatase A-like enzyme